MNDLVILHLSDLHIDSKGNKYSRLLVALLEDIRKQLTNFFEKKLVVVITGDIINAGDEKALSNAKKFFEKLKSIVENKIVALYIVPGNHDKKRTEFNSYMVPAYRYYISLEQQGINKFDSTYKKEFWPLQKKVYEESKYFELIDYIYDELFHMPDIGKIAKETYGVHMISIEDRKYCFVLLNTAWSCADEKDSRKLIVGKFQVDEVTEKFHELTDEDRVEMTFVMGHHPIENLYGEEQDMLFKNMISYTEMNASAYLCGHTHDRNVINWSNDRHAIYTFMTGFGWPEDPSDRVHEHYYSMYEFNIDLNTIDIYVRRTDDGSNFIPDLSIYTTRDTSSFENAEKIVRPIHINDALGEIQLSTSEKVQKKSLYSSLKFVEYGKHFMESMREILLDTGMIIHSYKLEIYETYMDKVSKTDKETKRLLWQWLSNDEFIDQSADDSNSDISNIIASDKFGAYDIFQGFMQRLCKKLNEVLVIDVSDTQVVRFHFRYLSDKTSELYSELCKSFSNSVKEECIQDNRISDMKYGDLLQLAYMNKETGCMIYSLNQALCKNKLNDKWKDFITVIPKFDRNKYVKRNGNSQKEYPMITFGVTINDMKYSTLLQCMDYYCMNQYLGDIIQTFLSAFPIDLNKFFNWIKKEDKKEAK